MDFKEPQNDVEALSLSLALMIMANPKIHDQEEIDTCEAYAQVLASKMTEAEVEQAKTGSLKLLGLEE